MQKLNGGGERHQEVEVVLAEASAKEGESGAQELAAAGQYDVQHLRQGGVVYLLDGVERGLHEGDVLLDGAVEQVCPHLTSSLFGGSSGPVMSPRPNSQAVAIAVRSATVCTLSPRSSAMRATVSGR